jgi:hypothetical protein
MARATTSIFLTHGSRDGSLSSPSSKLDVGCRVKISLIGSGLLKRVSARRGGGEPPDAVVSRHVRRANEVERDRLSVLLGVL